MSCDNNTQECTASGNVDIGQSLSILNFDISLTLGVGGEWNVNNGSIQIGGRAGIGPCDLFVGVTKISIGCTSPPPISQTYEMGWLRDKIQQKWVLVNWFRVGQTGFESFGARLGFANSPNSSINYSIVKSSANKTALMMQYYDKNLIVFP